MGKNFFKKSSLVIVMVLAVVLTLIPKTAVLANDDDAITPTIEYRAHVQDIGWMNFVSSGIAGTEGQSKRLEALEIKAQLPEGVELSARAHVQDIGWQDWQTKNDITVGTEGQFKRLEALQIAVKGLEGYEVKYRAHVEDIGWQDWVTANTDSDNNTLNVFAGTVGESKRLEALEIVVAETEESKLAKAKEDAIDELKGHLNPEEYSFNAEALESAIAEGEKAINEAATLEDVQSALEDAKAKLDAIPNDEKALSDAKAEAEAKIDEFVGTLSTTDYQTNMDELLGVINESSNKLHDATTPEEAAKVADEVIEALKAVKSDSQLLADAKAEAKQKIDEYMATLDTVKYSEKGHLEDVINIINKASDDLFNAKTPEEVQQVIDGVMKKLEEIKILVEHEHEYVYTDNGDGTHTGKCNICGETLEPEAHNFATVERIKEPTETEHGEDKYTCTACGQTKIEYVHNPVQTSNKEEATCPVHGYVGEIRCSVCKDLIQRNQRTKLTTDKDPTCTEDGYHWPWICIAKSEDGGPCRTVLSGVIPATGHKYSGEGTVHKQATKTEHGIKVYTCENCGELVSEDIHNYEGATQFVPDEENPNIHHPVCTVEGCNEVDKTQSFEHNWDSEGISKGKVTKQPTATEHGERTYTCQDCGYTKTEEVHSFAYAKEYKVDETDNKYHRAVCPVDGCGAVNTITESHDANVYTTNESEARCPKHGYVGEIKCSKCGEVVREDQRKRDWKGKMPTCEESGYIVGAYLCNWDGNCGETVSGKLEATGHKYSDTWTHVDAEDGSHYHVRKCTVEGCNGETDKKEVNFNEDENRLYKVIGNQHAAACSGYDECQQFSNELKDHSYSEYRNVDKEKDPDAQNNQKFVTQCACGHKIYQDTLTNALNDAKNTKNKTVVLDNEFTLNSNGGSITIPEDVTLHITENGSLKCSDKVTSYTIKNNGTLTVEGQIDSKILIAKPLNEEDTEELKEEVNDFSAALSDTNAHPLLKCLDGVKYDTKTNTITFETKKSDPCSDRLVFLESVSKDGVPFINKIFKDFKENATKADVIVNGQQKYHTELSSSSDNELLTVMKKLFENMSDGNKNVASLTINDLKGKSGIVRFYYYDQENNFEYYIDYTIAFA